MLRKYREQLVDPHEMAEERAGLIDDVAISLVLEDIPLLAEVAFIKNPLRHLVHKTGILGIIKREFFCRHIRISDKFLSPKKSIFKCPKCSISTPVY